MALALSAGVLPSGLVWAAPAQADAADDAFLSAMSSIGNGQSPIPLGILGF